MQLADPQGLLLPCKQLPTTVAALDVRDQQERLIQLLLFYSEIDLPFLLVQVEQTALMLRSCD
jgi:hypothetical protein